VPFQIVRSYGTAEAVPFQINAGLKASTTRTHINTGSTS
jgi:hypothetical protein